MAEAIDKPASPFLGLAPFYGKFIRDFAKTAHPFLGGKSQQEDHQSLDLDSEVFFVWHGLMLRVHVQWFDFHSIGNTLPNIYGVLTCNTHFDLQTFDVRCLMSVLRE